MRIKAHFYETQKGNKEKMTTKFDCYVERLEKKRREEREAAFNAELLRSLKTRSKGEVVAMLYENLTFIVGSADLLTSERAKTLVF